MTKVLAVTAIVLVAAILVVVTDLLMRPVPDGAVPRSDGQARLTLSPDLPPSLSTPEVALAPSGGTPPRCVVPADWGIHRVRKGNTLFSLAQQYGTDVQTLMQVNCLGDPTIYAGQRLYVPGPLALPTHATPTGVAVPEVEPVVEISATPPISPALSDVQVSLPEEQLNIVLLGTDERPESGEFRYKLGKRHVTVRTDAIVILSVDAENKLVRMLHIPRDLWVDIPGHGTDRINTAMLWGDLEQGGTGLDLVKRTIEKNLGIPIQYYVKVDFQGFIDIVDAMGGVDVDVACPLPEINMEPGMRHMDGVEALVYVQRRTTSSDFDRGRRQRQMMMTLWDQLLTPETIAKLPKLWVTLSGSYETDLPLDQAIGLAYLALQLNPQRIRMADIDGRHVVDWITPEGAMVLLPQEEKLRPFLERFYGPIDITRLERLGKTRVEVLNGSQRADAEQLAAAALRREGFKVARSGQASRRDYGQTEIYVYKGDPTAGQQLAAKLGVPEDSVQDYTAIPEPPDFSSPVDVRVVLGADYDPCWR